MNLVLSMGWNFTSLEPILSLSSVFWDFNLAIRRAPRRRVARTSHYTRLSSLTSHRDSLLLLSPTYTNIYIYKYIQWVMNKLDFYFVHVRSNRRDVQALRINWETVDQPPCFSYRDRERSRTRAHTHVHMHVHMRALHDAHRADASNAEGKGGSFTKRPNENAAPARVLVFFQSCPIITPHMMRALQTRAPLVGY